MYQLLLDSSNIYLTVALAKDCQLVDSIFYNAWQRQSDGQWRQATTIRRYNR